LFITLISFTIFICDIFFFLPVVTPLIIIVLSLSYVEDSRQQFHLVRNNLALKCPRSFSCSKHTDEQPWASYGLRASKEHTNPLPHHY
jgi:hypothetical protein